MDPFIGYKEEIVKTGKTILREGLVIGTWGNVSMRLPKENLFAITASGIAYEKMTENDIVILDYDGNIIHGKRLPSIEWSMHAAVYKVREDVGAIIHTHSVHASAMAVARKPIPPAVEDLVQIVGGGVEVSKYALPGTEKLAQNVVKSLGDRMAVMISNHGLMGVGKDMEEALNVCRVVEKGAQISILASKIGNPVMIPQEEVQEMREFYLKSYGQKKAGVNKEMYRSFREPLNGLTHFIGFLLGIAALVVLVVIAAKERTVWHVVSFSLYGTSLMLLYLFSTLYHWLPLSKGKIKFFRKLDHIMIFVLIAGSYTPLCLVPLRGKWGWSIFGVVWGLAIMGFFMKLFWMNMPRKLYVSIYIFMGWIALIAIFPISRSTSSGALFYLFFGGALYSLGAIIYARKRPNPFPGVFGFHEIWHIFVMAGSFAHFWMMYHYIMPL